jgi:hypothetical protein
MGEIKGSASCGARTSRQGVVRDRAITTSYDLMQINLLNLLADFAQSEFHSRAKQATGQA